jgi:type I restriction-modification system DNA methylase subunit
MTRDQLKKLERDPWSAADKLRANSDLKASEYSTPVLGLIFLKFADNKYRQHEEAIAAEYQKLKGTRRERTLQEIGIERCGFALGPLARYDYLLNLPEKEDVAKANGLRGEVKQANAYYEDPFGSFGAFDYVLANPPFNVDDVSLEQVEKDSTLGD